MIEEMSEADAKEAIANANLCKQLGAALFKANPSRRWYVEVIDHGHIAVIKIPEISMEFGMVVHLTGSIMVDIKQVIMAGSELLERFNLTRGRSDNHDLMSLERNHKGVIGAKKGELH